MKKVTAVLLLLPMAALFLALAGSAAAAAGTLLEENFDSVRTNGLYARCLESPYLEVVPGEGVDGTAGLKTTYVGYEQGSHRVGFRYPLGTALDEATLNYDVRFADDFLFVQGGKLHGLGPDKPVTGGRTMRPDGWSARATFKTDGGFSTYVYCQNKQGKYGQHIPAEDFSFQKDRYYAVSLHVRVNDPGQANGFMHVYVDGRQIIAHDGIEYRAADGDRTLITQFLFSTFHGGHTPPYAPIDKNGKYITVHAFFDNIAVYAGKRIRSDPGH
jgi:hypothetical protein